MISFSNFAIIPFLPNSNYSPFKVENRENSNQKNDRYGTKQQYFHEKTHFWSIIVLDFMKKNLEEKKHEIFVNFYFDKNNVLAYHFGLR